MISVGVACGGGDSLRPSFFAHWLEFYCKEELSLLLHIQSILIIHRLWIWEFTFRLKFILIALSWSLVDTCRAVTNLKHLKHALPAEVRQGNTLPPDVSSPAVNKCPLLDRFTAIFFTFSCFLLAISRFKMSPKHSADMPSSALNCEGTVCLQRKKCLLAELHSGRSHSAVGCELHVNESAN